MATDRHLSVGARLDLDLSTDSEREHQVTREERPRRWPWVLELPTTELDTVEAV